MHSIACIGLRLVLDVVDVWRADLVSMHSIACIGLRRHDLPNASDI